MITLKRSGPAGASARTNPGERPVPACPICGGPAVRQRVVVRAGAVASCGVCGSWYRVPRPTLDELRSIYDRSYYDAWGLHRDAAITEATKRATFGPLLDRLTRLMPDGRGEGRRILDVGAATGSLLQLAVERGWSPFAVELNPHAAQILRQRFGEHAVWEGELTDCTFPPRSFDAITMTDLLEHVLDVGGTLRAAAALLRPGGVLCLTTPCVDSLSRRLMGRNWLHFKLEHVQYFSRSGIRSAVVVNGFEDPVIRGASKHLTFDYLRCQLETYPHWLLTPTTRALAAILPAGLRSRPVPVRCGEILVLARRAQG